MCHLFTRENNGRGSRRNSSRHNIPYSNLVLFIVALSFLSWLPQSNAAFSGWIDPDTKASDRVTRSFTDGAEYDLVMSDEFNVDSRTFKDGHDPMWTAIDRSDDDQTSQGRRSLQFYNSSMISTKDGKLVISTNTEDTKWRGWNPYKKKYEQLKRSFKSGMLQSWNKFCFTGGILEVDIKLPGSSEIGGLWPAVWLLGNLGRATYETSTNLMWPWSYSECDRSLQYAQEISGCDVTSHYSLHPGQGRGATEIDMVEVMAGPSAPLPFVKNKVHRPYNSMTLQVSPGIPSSKRRPMSGTLPEWGFHWYRNLTYGKNTSINPFFYGTYLGATKSEEPVKRSKLESYQCDAISAITSLDDSYFSRYHRFRLEWQPGPEGYIHWYIDDIYRFGVEAESLKEMGTQIPQEPSSIVLNTAISTSWGFPNLPWGCTKYDCKDPEGQCGMNPGFCRTLPAQFLIDYVRVYQRRTSSGNPRNGSEYEQRGTPENYYQTVGCNPKDFPTKKFIAGHDYRYKTQDATASLQEVVKGGGNCHSHEDCGSILGTTRGTCRRGKCRCEEDWTGPKCLVPTYQDDFPDWEDVGVFDMPPAFPVVPKFLLLAGVTLLLSLCVVAVRPMIAKRNGVEYKALPMQ